MRLEQQSKKRHVPGPYSFQFHKGAIRTLQQQVTSLECTPFQFHKGAIRTELSQDGKLYLSGFQFHKGAIRTANALAYTFYTPISIP